MKRFLAVTLLCALLIASIPLSASAHGSKGIQNNGLNGIYIDIYSSQFTTLQKVPEWGQYAYGPSGCAWFASARQWQLTGNNPKTIYSGYSWYYSAYSYFGYSRGATPRAKALACWENHVAVVERVDGDTITISEGGYNWADSASYDYCIIRTRTRTQLEKNSGNGAFYGYVYLNVPQTVSVAWSESSKENIQTDQPIATLARKATISGASVDSNTRCGIILKDSNGEVLAQKEERAYANSGTTNVVEMWYSVSDELGYTMEPGTEYQYMCYLILNGKTYNSDTYSFTSGGQAHIHSYENPVVTKQATCTEEGTLTYTCSCGATKTEAINALGHAWDDGVVTTQPTETASGVRTFTCTRCSTTKTESIPPVSHTHSYTATVTAPTCTEQGYTTYVCSCGDSYKDSYTAALGHNYSYKVTATPTTSATGTLTGTCSRCSGKTTITLPKLNTTDYSYSVVKAATCTATGTGRYTWKTTTYGSYYFDVTLAKTSHNYTAKVTAPTCTAQGYTTHTCTACGDSYKDSYTAALGHSESAWIIDRNPTCTASGSKHTECTRCGQVMQTATLAANGHTASDWIIDKNATCTASGTKHTECTACGTTLETSTIPALGHSYSASVKQPTCTEQGYTTHTCIRCGDSYIDTYVDALGHAWDNGVVTVEPTEIEEGVKTFTCTRCGTTKTEPIPVLTHTHSYTAVVTAPTCTEKGYTTHTCACGDSYIDTYVDALGHAWDDGVVSKEPTATEDGEKTFTCTRCDATRTEAIPATGEQSEEPCDGGADCPSAKFVDVNPKEWYHPYVDYAVTHGLFSGTSANTFEPEASMTRAMLVTVLWRYEGAPMGYQNPFLDVPNGQWYTDAVAWAAANEIVGGVGGNRFDPDGNVTREQMAAILFRYANKKGIDTSKRGELGSFPDAGKISSYAKDAIAWTVAEGVINGSDGKLLPQGDATRAQVSAILMRFIENIVKK